eukprot:TRINITY_DN4317_c0_g1_i2.p3 TRINITY_DN4317_c0_g1~~TRINITY_DN4317_c0_g1_i2.p3  ORF type:complete len:126 (+),score=2.08 TRINITY_DN4317_c0_g1_i2:1071-1448(+)
MPRRPSWPPKLGIQGCCFLSSFFQLYHPIPIQPPPRPPPPLYLAPSLPSTAPGALTHSLPRGGIRVAVRWSRLFFSFLRAPTSFCEGKMDPLPPPENVTSEAGTGCGPGTPHRSPDALPPISSAH